jgi:DNA repair exonuclease SbcCD ATPase subunit
MIKTLYMKNCGPFRGEHTITFGDGAYAIVARHETDPRKSNRVGKSFILEMIDFPITGRFNKSRGYDADGWITNGEREALVRLTFEDGAYVERSKRRGQSTQVRFVRPGEAEAAQDAAVTAVLKYIGLDVDDFRNAVYFEQRKMAKLVDPEQTKPADRLEVISGWFGLGLAERAEELAGDRAAEHEKELTRFITQREAVQARLNEDANEDVDALAKKVAELGNVMRTLEDERKEADKIEEARETIEAQEKRIAEVKRLREELERLVDVSDAVEVARARVTEASHAVTSCAEEIRKRKKTALGLFDGACPVAPIQCPAKKQINGDRSANEKALEAARAPMAGLEAKHAEVVAQLDPLLQKQRVYFAVQRDLDRAREAVRDAADAVREAKAILRAAPKLDADFACWLDYQKAFNDRIETAENEIREATVQLGIARNNAQARTRARGEIDRLGKEIDAKHRIVSLHLRARAIFRLAQRRVAERNLTFVENEANYQLGDAGIDLTVKARWEREAGGPAKTCEDCGAAFPASAKVKTCERCGTARGQHTVQRLDFILSDRSGAFNDIGGIVLQLSAGSWLLGSRHSPWACAMLDEPFAACDAYNRRALATQFLRLLSRGVWRQAIVISHSPDTVDVYPHKIIITERADGSRTIEQT